MDQSYMSDTGAQAATEKWPTNRTTACHSIAIAPEQLAYILEQGKHIVAKKIADEISELFIGLKANFEGQRFIKMDNKKIWFDRNVAGLFPCFESVELPVFDTKTTQAAKFKGMDYEGFHFDTMTAEECRVTFSIGNGNPYLNREGFCYHLNRKCYKDSNGNNGFFLTRETRDDASCVVDTFGNVFQCLDDDLFTLVPIHRLRKANGGVMTFADAVMAWLDKGLIPAGLIGEQKKNYRFVMKALPYISRYCTTEKDAVSFDGEKFRKDVKNGKFTADIFSYDFSNERLSQDILQGKKNYSGSLEVIRQELLKCDYKRANIEPPYDSKRLTDLNLGHWELFEEPKEGALVLTLLNNEYFVARPPQLDVMTSSVCAIDFGTKSTVVACRDQNQEERLLRIGQGDYTKAADLEDYENPTVVELVDIENFLKAYRGRGGRPFTEWNQMMVSHQAEDALKKAKNSMVYYSVFSELKQWANDKDRRLMLRDRKGNLVELRSYEELQDGDFDPIELYAYYLGLYINNMHRGIYLDYILSFPVTYETAVRERILHSFERGLKKSLPPALLRDEDMMRRFRVYAGASEPAAYAISALQEFGLEPKKDGEAVSYAVFDFGGGTTDYDFGVERIPQDHRRRYVIERLGRGGGNPYLGGENILSLLAYEVFKDNIAEMRQKRITFAMPPSHEAASFAGDEMLVLKMRDASQQAHMNTKKLAEMLRPVWEQQDGYRKKFETEQKIDLFPNSGDDGEKQQETVNVTLRVDVERLEARIEEIIEAGIADFFTELKHAFVDLESTPIHIFLAGNSCKSPVVQKIFRKYIDSYEKIYADEIRKATAKEKNTKGMFKPYLPLGMENIGWDGAQTNTGDEVDHMPTESQIAENDDTEVEESEQKNNENLDIDKIRTGKTGVVFGLLRSRKGGRDVKIVDRDIAEQQEIIFPYYLGDIDHNNHFHVRIGKDIPYKEWVPFLPADEGEFELYYTKAGQSMENQMSANEVSMVRCVLNDDDVDDEKNVYIRKVAPDAIEYAVGASADDFVKDFHGQKQILR